MTTDSNSLPRESRESWDGLVLHVVLALTCVFIFIGLLAWSGRARMDLDEQEHAHAAWLMHEGLRPYSDFWEHHPPHYWHFLKTYYVIHGEDVGVFQWGRNWMLVTFALSVFATYLLGRELFGVWAGIAGAMLFCSNRLMHCAAVIMRPDGWMLALLMMGTFVFVRSWRRTFAWPGALLSGFLLGSSFAFHPRAGFTIAALAMVVVLDLVFVKGKQALRQRWVGLACFAVVAWGMVLAPFLVHGFGTYFMNVYRWSTAALPSFSAGPTLTSFLVMDRLLFGLMIFATAVCVVSIVKRRKDSIWDLALLLFTAFNVVGICIATRPFVQVFYVLGPFAALFAARGIEWLRRHASEGVATIAVLLLAVVAVVTNATSPYWNRKQEFGPHLAYIEDQNRLIPVGERYAGPVFSHPVFRLDGTRYWLDADMSTFFVVDPSFEHDFVAELKLTRPFLLHDGFSAKFAYDPGQTAAFDAFVSEHYTKMDDSPYYLICE